MIKSLVDKIHKIPIIYIWAFIIGLFILVAGVISSRFFSDLTEAEESNRISEQASLIASVVHVDDLTSLNVSNSDTSNECYLRIKHQFIDFCNQIPSIRYIYLFGKNNKNEIFFYLDTESDKNRLLSKRNTALPGEIYIDAPPDFLRIFQEQNLMVLQPYTDQWGSFVSVLVPVFNQNNEIIAGVGVDLETDRWDKLIYYKRMFPIQFSLVFISIIALISIFLRYRIDLKKETSEMFVRFQSLMDSSKNAMILFSIDYKVLYFNNSIALFVDVFLNQPLKIGQNILESIKNDQHRANFYDNTQFLLAKNHININIKFNAKTFSLDYQYIQSNETDVPFIVLTVKDVTNPINEELKKSVLIAQHKLLLSHYNFATLLIDERFQILEANSVFFKKNGLNISNIDGHFLSDYFEHNSITNLQFFLGEKNSNHPINKQFELQLLPEYSLNGSLFLVHVIQVNVDSTNVYLLISLDNSIINQPVQKIKEELESAFNMIDSLPGFTYRCKNDSFWTMIYLSKGFEKITGYQVDDVLFNARLSFNDIIVPKYRDLIAEKWEQSRINKSLFECEYEIIVVNGNHRWVMERGLQIFDPDGCVIELNGYITDITSFRSSFAELELETNSLRSYIDQAPYGMMQMDSEMNIIRANTAILNLLEYNLNFVRAQKLSFFIHPDLFYRYSVFIKKLFDFGSASEDVKIVTKSNTIKYINLNALKFDNDEYILYFIDQTQKHETQKQLLTQDRFLHSIIDAMKIPFGIFNIDSNAIEYSNSPFESMLNPSLKQIIGLELDSTTNNYSLIKKVTETQNCEFEELILSNENSVSFLINAVPLSLDGEKILIFLIDVSYYGNKIKTLETELQKSIALTLAKNDFFANISHEIRTPLNGIIGVAEVLRNSLSDDNQRHYLDVVKESSLNLINLINNLLDYSKIEAGKIDLVREPFYPEDLLNSLAILFLPLCDNKALSFHVSIDTSFLQPIVSDEIRIRQILINLIGNAIKFTNTGTISVSFYPQECDFKSYIEMTVSDTGIGIPNDKIDYIFENFTQLKTDSSDKTLGTGLGLSICSRIVNLLEGDIEVKSQLGIGTTIKVKIPIGFVENQSTRIKNFQFNDIKSLVVVENDFERSFLQKILTDIGVDVFVCKNGVEALQLLSKMDCVLNPINCLFVDYDVNTLTCTDVINAIQVNKKEEILFFVLAKQVDFQMAQLSNSQSQISKVLLKPILPSAIINALQLQKTNCKVEDDVINFVKLSPSVRVLIAEDDAVNMLIIKEILHFSNANIILASDGQDAYVKFLTHRPHLIFMDIHMPIMDGFEVVNLIRNYQIENPNFIKPYIIALTAELILNKKEDYLLAGMNEYISKPYKIQDINNCLLKYLEYDEKNV